VILEKLFNVIFISERNLFLIRANARSQSTRLVNSELNSASMIAYQEKSLIK